MPEESPDEPWWDFVPDGIPAGPGIEDIRQLVALGGLVRESSQLEMTLRSLFCGLLDSKYASVTAAGQNVSWLIDNCRATIKRRSDLTEPQQAEILGLLDDAAKAMNRRNRFVHDVWVSERDNSSSLMRSKRGDHSLGREAVTTDETAEIVRTITRCSVRIGFWLDRALPDGSMMEAQLRWEDYLRETRDS